MKKPFLWVLLFCWISALFSPCCQAGEGERIKAFVSILPQACFVERIGGDHVDVEVMVGPGRSPATYEPTPKQLSRLAGAQIYFRIGTPFEEGFIKKIRNTHKDLIIVDMRKGIELRYFNDRKGGQRPDPHIWLDPKRVKRQAETICSALSRLNPGWSAGFERNFKVFQDDLDVLDAGITKNLAPFRGRSIFVFHPAFGYFAESYGLVQVAVEMEGKQPGAKQIARLIERARKGGVKVIFVQPQFSERDAGTIAEAIGGAVIKMDPLPRDYIGGLATMAESIRENL